MFEKLLSALPFNPSVTQQLSFYAKRMRQEQSVRRIGLIFIVFAFLIQFFAFVSPPQSSSASSPNDLVDGGFSNAAGAYTDCVNNVGAGPGSPGYQTILANYGITCTEVANAPTLTINSRDWNSELWSMGRTPDSNLSGETPVTIGSSGTIYARYLWAWDSSGTSSNYQVLNVTSTGGQTFFLMYACGNLVSVNFPQPVAQPPNLGQPTKTTEPGYPEANSTVAPGTVLGYRIYWSNSGGAATDVSVDDPQPANTTFSNFYPSTANIAGFSGGATHWGFDSMPAGATNWYVDVYYQVNANVANGTVICNTASVAASGISPIPTNQICMTVQVAAPTPTPTPPTPAPTPQQPIQKSPCEQQISSENQSACISTSKSASNLTEDISNANNTTAKAGDVIQYTLSATNIGSSKCKDYLFQDNLSYVLDYSTMTNANGGTLDANDDISWPAVDIDPGQTVTKTFTVTVDNPIPQTPTSTSDPNYYNLKMFNQFGPSTVTITLPTTTVAAIQTASTTLPNTGPGNSMLIGAVVVALAGFFFYRSRLLAKESKIAVTETAGRSIG